MRPRILCVIDVIYSLEPSALRPVSGGLNGMSGGDAAPTIGA